MALRVDRGLYTEEMLDCGSGTQAPAVKSLPVFGTPFIAVRQAFPLRFQGVLTMPWAETPKENYGNTTRIELLKKGTIEPSKEA